MLVRLRLSRCARSQHLRGGVMINGVFVKVLHRPSVVVRRNPAMNTPGVVLWPLPSPLSSTYPQPTRDSALLLVASTVSRASSTKCYPDQDDTNDRSLQGL